MSVDEYGGCTYNFRVSPIKHEERVEVRVPKVDLKLWKAAADAERMSLSAWIRHHCNHVAAVTPRTVARKASR